MNETLSFCLDLDEIGIEEIETQIVICTILKTIEMLSTRNSEILICV